MHQAVAPHWRDGPKVPSLSNRELDVWRIPLDSSGNAQLTTPRTQAATALREILSRYLAQPSDTLVIDRHPGGKPYLVADDCPLEFNLSHTRGMALIAVSAHRPVGVDIEAIRPIEDPLRLARRVMDEESVKRLERVFNPDQRLQLFIDLWTRLEARQKTLGRGIFAPPITFQGTQSFGFRIDDGWLGCVAIAAPPGQAEPRFYRFEAS